MFENLSDRFQETFRKLAGRAALSEANIQDAVGEVRLALLDADVSFDVVQEVASEMARDCLGEDVLKSVSPGQQFVKVVQSHLTSLMGDAHVALDLHGAPATIMLAGLHGSGKTTTAAKLALHLQKLNKRILLVAADVYRPAAIEQLNQLGAQIGVQVYSEEGVTDVPAIAANARRFARQEGADVMIVDTAGRFQIDEELVQELVQIKDRVSPCEILLVCDAALGQEAVSVATHFHQALSVTGIILTKLDGDARGGAALSMRRVTTRPIKFVGTGEKLEDLELFHPDRMADRILGMGDVVSLVEKAEAVIDEEDARKLEKKLLSNAFDFEDFLTALGQMQKLGGIGSMLELLPVGKEIREAVLMNEDKLKFIEAMIFSMTPKERNHPELFSSNSRRDRVARGSGRPRAEMDQLVQQHKAMQGMMSKLGPMAKMFGAGGDDGGGMPMLDPMQALQGMGGMPGMPGMPGPRGKPQRVLSQKEKKRRRKKGRR